MSEFINTIDALGDDVVFISIIGGSIAEFKDNIVTNVGSYIFSGCTRLKNVDLPNATSIGKGVFSYCVGLQNINLPNVTSIENQGFYVCRSLTKVDLPNVTSIGADCFYICEKLNALILRSSTLCTLANKNAFDSTPIKSGTGYIYVPRALLSDDDSTKDYRRATNWSTFANQFRALEDYTVDGTTTGALDETKI